MECRQGEDEPQSVELRQAHGHAVRDEEVFLGGRKEEGKEGRKGSRGQAGLVRLRRGELLCCCRSPDSTPSAPWDDGEVPDPRASSVGPAGSYFQGNKGFSQPRAGAHTCLALALKLQLNAEAPGKMPKC